MTAKIFTTQNLLWLALILAMAGSLKHLAAIFASIDGNVFMGWLQAIAIDAGLFALAYSIRQRKATRRNPYPLWFGVVLFTSISVYGNYTYGLIATGAQLPNWIVASKPIVLAASLPLLVLYLAEMVSDNNHFAHTQKPVVAQAQEVKIEQEHTRNLPKLRVNDNEILSSANEIRQVQKQERLDQLALILEDKPQASNTELAEMLEVSTSTIRNYKQQLNGRLAR